jgi:hypothetical protein
MSAAPSESVLLRRSLLPDRRSGDLTATVLRGAAFAVLPLLVLSAAFLDPAPDALLALFAIVGLLITVSTLNSSQAPRIPSTPVA